MLPAALSGAGLWPFSNPCLVLWPRRCCKAGGSGAQIPGWSWGFVVCTDTFQTGTCWHLVWAVLVTLGSSTSMRTPNAAFGDGCLLSPCWSQIPCTAESRHCVSTADSPLSRVQRQQAEAAVLPAGPGELSRRQASEGLLWGDPRACFAPRVSLAAHARCWNEHSL